MGKQLRVVDLEQPFECGGKTYIPTTELSFNRYEKMQEYYIEMGFSATFVEIFNNLRKFWDLYNSGKPADGLVVIHNVMEGIGRLEKKWNVAFRICSLFINEEGEDITTFDEGKMNAKIDAWSKELDTIPFFQKASNLVPGWMPAYNIVLNDILEKEQKKS